jgi:hypothetical protein
MWAAGSQVVATVLASPNRVNTLCALMMTDGARNSARAAVPISSGITSYTPRQRRVSLHQRPDARVQVVTYRQVDDRYSRHDLAPQNPFRVRERQARIVRGHLS